MRVLLTAAALVLFQEPRVALEASELRRAMAATLPRKFLKVRTTLQETWRRIVIVLPACHPWHGLWRRAAVAAGAS